MVVMMVTIIMVTLHLDTKQTYQCEQCIIMHAWQSDVHISCIFIKKYNVHELTYTCMNACTCTGLLSVVKFIPCFSQCMEWWKWCNMHWNLNLMHYEPLDTQCFIVWCSLIHYACNLVCFKLFHNLKLLDNVIML